MDGRKQAKAVDAIGGAVRSVDASSVAHGPDPVSPSPDDLILAAMASLRLANTWGKLNAEGRLIAIGTHVLKAGFDVGDRPMPACVATDSAKAYCAALHVGLAGTPQARLAIAAIAARAMTTFHNDGGRHFGVDVKCRSAARFRGDDRAQAKRYGLNIDNLWNDFAEQVWNDWQHLGEEVFGPKGGVMSEGNSGGWAMPLPGGHRVAMADILEFAKDTTWDFANGMREDPDQEVDGMVIDDLIREADRMLRTALVAGIIDTEHGAWQEMFMDFVHEAIAERRRELVDKLLGELPATLEERSIRQGLVDRGMSLDSDLGRIEWIDSEIRAVIGEAGLAMVIDAYSAGGDLASLATALIATTSDEEG
jgi:hypothetical protein